MYRIRKISIIIFAKSKISRIHLRNRKNKIIMAKHDNQKSP
jgi:hypothetical protein